MRVLVVNAGSSSLKLSRARRRPHGRRPTTVERWEGEGHLRAARRSSSTGCGRPRRRRPPGRARRPAAHRAGARRRRPARLPGLDRRTSRRCTTRARWRRCARWRRLLPDAARGRLLRHRLPRHAAGGRPHLRAARGVERAVVAAPLRLPRPLPRLRRTAGGGARRAAGSPTCGSSPATSAPAPRWRRCAAGVSVDTTMGFTPLDGLVMATRLGIARPGPAAVAARSTGESAPRPRRRRSSTARG